MSFTRARGSYLGLPVVLKLVAGESIEGVPVLLQEVASDGPNVAEDERCADQHVQLHGVGVHVRPAARWEEQSFQQFAQRHHFADIHLNTHNTALGKGAREHTEHGVGQGGQRTHRTQRWARGPENTQNTALGKGAREHTEHGVGQGGQRTHRTRRWARGPENTQNTALGKGAREHTEHGVGQGGQRTHRTQRWASGPENTQNTALGKGSREHTEHSAQ